MLAGIVVLADVRETQYLFTFVRNLPFGDKIGHFCLMRMFSFVVNLAQKARTFRVWKLNYPFGSLIVFAVVCAEEISRFFVRGRTCAIDCSQKIQLFAAINLARFSINSSFSFAPLIR